MNSDFYFLSADEIERFDATFETDSTVLQMIDDAAVAWRETIRPQFQSAGACRYAFMSRSVVLIAKPRPDRKWEIADLPSLARYLCRRVENRVAELDAAEADGELPEKEVKNPGASSEAFKNMISPYETEPKQASGYQTQRE